MIRQFINHKKRTIAEEGCKIWNKRARKENLKLSEQEMSKVARLFNYDSLQSLFYNLFTSVDKIRCISMQEILSLQVK